MNKNFKLIILLITIFLINGCSDYSPPEDDEGSQIISTNTSLSDLKVTTDLDIFYPNFDSDIYHYTADCVSDGTVLVEAATLEQLRISINGDAKNGLSHEATFNDLVIENDIVINVTNGPYSSDYVIHCIDSDFPEITVTHKDELLLDDGFYIISPRYTLDDQSLTYLLIIDENAVPRFRKKINGIATDFKRHGNGQYSYAQRTIRNDFGHWDNEIVILNVSFEEVDRVQTIGLNHTDNHDFLISNEDTYILMSYNSAYRDLSPYGLSNNELTRDSVIQEISKDGQILMQWDSFDHVDIEDCTQHRWPDDYAHINAVSISEDDNLVLSLRGCSQILKIDRYSAETIWQLGGSNPDLIIFNDSYQEICGQHTASELNGYLYIFDNGGHCIGSRESSLGQVSRALKYELNFDNNYAIFVDDYSLNDTYSEYTPSGGSLFLSPNGNWVINWSLRSGQFSTIDELSEDGTLAMSIKLKKGDLNPRTYRVYKETDLLLPVNIAGNIFFYGAKN
tara:strand:+ start:1326 stop:2849 length:1524 start_codon:yes stop_codon:yes gene_type:complete